MRILTGLTVCLLVGACGGEEPTVAALISQVSSQELDAEGRRPSIRFAVEKLGDLGDRAAVPALVEVLRTNPSANTRSSAMMSLGQLRAVDAIPVVIDAMLDMYGALWNTNFALVQIMGHNPQFTGRSSRANIVAHQRTLRDWYRKYENKLREHVSQPGPSQVTAGEAPPPHDGSATREQVAGPYVGRRWNYAVLVYLFANGSFAFRGASESMHLKREAGTWFVNPDGVNLVWKFAPMSTAARWQLSMEFRRKYTGKLAPRADGPETTIAAWSGGTLYMYPECRAPFDFALKRASKEDLAQLDPELQTSESEGDAAR